MQLYRRLLISRFTVSEYTYIQSTPTPLLWDTQLCSQDMLSFTQVYCHLPCRLIHISFPETHPTLCHFWQLAPSCSLFSLISSPSTLQSLFSFHDNNQSILFPWKSSKDSSLHWLLFPNLYYYIFCVCFLYFLYTPVYFIYVDNAISPTKL